MMAAACKKRRGGDQSEHSSGPFSRLKNTKISTPWSFVRRQKTATNDAFAATKIAAAYCRAHDVDALMSSKPSSTTAALAGFLLGTTLTLAVSCVINRRCRKTGGNDAFSTKNTPIMSMPESLREEQLSRHLLYFGQEGMESLRNSRVIIVGLGGVGSHAAHMLARSGVSHLRIIDFDQVTLSSLNRHACATLADVGTPKATCLQSFLQQICPDPQQLHVEAIVQMYTADEQGKALLDGEWNIVIDAIDDVPTKAALLAHCVERKIRVISCMGAGGKSDVTRLHISDLRTASRDPLASKLRQNLKKLLPQDNDYSYMDNMDQLAVVFSSEKTVVKLCDFTDEQKAEGVHEFGAVDGMRIRVLPVLGTMPALMGIACCAMAVCELGKKPFSPVSAERVGRGVRHKLLQRIKRREKLIQDSVEESAGDTDKAVSVEGGRIVNGKWIGPVQIDGDDVEYLLEVWRNRCAVTGDRLGTVLELARWDLAHPSTCNNIVLMGASALRKFDTKGKSTIPEDVQARIEARLRMCRPDANAY